MENEPNLTMLQGMVDHLIVEDDECKGVVTQTGRTIVQSLLY